jgi:hypothetical protein
MTSIPVLIFELLRLVIQPAVLGPIAVGMALVRELGPEWKNTFARFGYDLLLLLVSALFVILLGLELAAAPVA